MLARVHIITLFLLGSISSSFAQSNINLDKAKKYQACISSVKVDSAQSLNTAKKWYIEGGGVPAQHCEALSLYAQERYFEAATLLEDISEKVTREEGIGIFATENKELLTVQLQYLAGKSWQAADRLDNAYNIYSVTLRNLEEKSPLAYDIYVDRGLVQAVREEYDSAIEDFTSALEINSEKIDAFLYRAETFRKMKEHIKARLDLNAGLSRSPYQPDLLFESGINYRLQGRNEKAKAEWQKLIDEYPGTSWQDLGEDNIKLITE